MRRSLRRWRHPPAARRLRAGHASAATAFLRAAELSTDEPAGVAADRRGRACRLGCRPTRPGRELIARALPSADRETRAQLLHLSGVIEARTGSLRDACHQLLEGAE